MTDGFRGSGGFKQERGRGVMKGGGRDEKEGVEDERTDAEDEGEDDRDDREDDLSNRWGSGGCEG